jgi:hypothetical protein
MGECGKEERKRGEQICGQTARPTPAASGRAHLENAASSRWPSNRPIKTPAVRTPAKRVGATASLFARGHNSPRGNKWVQLPGACVGRPLGSDSTPTDHADHHEHLAPQLTPRAQRPLLGHCAAKKSTVILVGFHPCARRPLGPLGRDPNPCSRIEGRDLGPWLSGSMRRRRVSHAQPTQIKTILADAEDGTFPNRPFAFIVPIYMALPASRSRPPGSPDVQPRCRGDGHATDVASIRTSRRRSSEKPMSWRPFSWRSRWGA